MSLPSDANQGITPAWAGKSVIFLLAVKAAEDYPRVGGEE